ncbi:MAG: ATP-binding protein, partial [Clostridia bacterium]
SCKIWEIKKYIEYAKKNNIDFDVIYMDNYYGNVHGVPQNVIDSMKNRYEKYNGEILSNKYLENL